MAVNVEKLQAQLDDTPAMKGQQRDALLQEALNDTISADNGGCPDCGHQLLHDSCGVCGYQNTDERVTFDDTDMANAKRIGKRRGEDIRWTPHASWLVWDGKRWAEDLGDVRIQGIAKSCMEAIFDEIRRAPDRDQMMTHAKRSQSRRAIEAAVALLRSEPGVLASLQDFDRDPWLLSG